MTAEPRHGTRPRRSLRRWLIDRNNREAGYNTAWQIVQEIEAFVAGPCASCDDETCPQRIRNVMGLACADIARRHLPGSARAVLARQNGAGK